MRSTQAALADKAHRYWQLTRLIADARRTAAGLHDELVAAIVATGEPIDVEGLPTLRLVDRRAGRLWDVKALAQHEPREFQRLLELGCLTVQDKLADAQMQAGHLSGIHRQFSWETMTSALVFDYRRGRRQDTASRRRATAQRHEHVDEDANQHVDGDTNAHEHGVADKLGSADRLAGR